MRHRGTKVFHIFRRDDADSGVLRQYTYTLDPINGSDEETDGVVTFDVRNLSTWQAPPHPPFLNGNDDTPDNRKAWKRHEAGRIEEKAIKAAIRAALDKGEIGSSGSNSR